MSHPETAPNSETAFFPSTCTCWSVQSPMHACHTHNNSAVTSLELDATFLLPSTHISTANGAENMPAVAGAGGRRYGQATARRCDPRDRAKSFMDCLSCSTSALSRNDARLATVKSFSRVASSTAHQERGTGGQLHQCTQTTPCYYAMHYIHVSSAMCQRQEARGLCAWESERPTLGRHNQRQEARRLCAWESERPTLGRHKQAV